MEAEINKLPDNSNGNGFRDHFNRLREQYISENQGKTPESKAEAVKLEEIKLENNTPKAPSESLNKPVKLAHNDYFSANKQKLVGQEVWIDGTKYRAIHLNAD